MNFNNNDIHSKVLTLIKKSSVSESNQPSIKKPSVSKSTYFCGNCGKKVLKNYWFSYDLGIPYQMDDCDSRFIFFCSTKCMKSISNFK